MTTQAAPPSKGPRLPTLPLIGDGSPLTLGRDTFPISAIFARHETESWDFRRGVIAGAQLGDLVSKLLRYRARFEVVIPRSLKSRVVLAAKILGRALSVRDCGVEEDPLECHARAEFAGDPPLIEAPARAIPKVMSAPPGPASLPVATRGFRRPLRVGRCMVPDHPGARVVDEAKTTRSLFVEFEGAKSRLDGYTVFMRIEDAVRVAREILDEAAKFEAIGREVGS